MYYFISVIIFQYSLAYHENDWKSIDSSLKQNTNDNNRNNDSDCKTKQKTTIYKELKNNIVEIKIRCGSLCNIEYDDQFKESLSNRTFKAVQKTVDCYNLWHSSILDKASKTKYPIQKIPSYLVQYFTYNGRVKILYDYRDDTNTENHVTNRWGNLSSLILTYLLYISNFI